MLKQQWILVTGYGPFATVAENPSWLAVEALPDSILSKGGAEITLVKKKLRVSYGDVEHLYEQTFPELVREFGGPPLRIVHVGVSATTNCVLLERFAYNKTVGVDVDGKVPKNGLIDAALPLDSPRDTSLGLIALLNFLEVSGACNVKVSTDPGRYLCNFVYFKALEKQGPSLFVHVPNSTLPEAIASFSNILKLICAFH